jgi:hypothetical protein
MLGITFKTPVDGMARVTNRDLPNPKVGQEIHQRRKCQRAHRHQRLTAGKEVNAGCYAQAHNGKPDSSIEIFLDI